MQNTKIKKNPAAVALGKIKSTAKADAARRNGRLGGRPSTGSVDLQQWHRDNCAPLSPVEVQMLMHCYYCHDDHPMLHYPAWQEALAKFKRLGVLRQRENSSWGCNRRGDAWVKAICAVQRPNTW